ncbi:MAG: hypothetical protein M0Z57_07020 [Deltaproteobacteria bacterium]|nr:hypothetical protein [Deltaproteobacteria bacterium]
MLNEHPVYDISNKVLKFGLSLYEWLFVLFIAIAEFELFHVGIQMLYDLLSLALLVIVLKVYKIGKPDAYVKSVIVYYFLQDKNYFVAYKFEKKNDNVAFSLWF